MRAVLLGASNLARSIAIAVETARLLLPGPIEYMIAMGHGRSYGTRSRVLGRGLPGIVECGLWDALAGRPPLPTAALVTDVGNDIAYGADLATIEGWVDTCLERLAAAGARTVLTLPPLASLAALSPLRFNVARAILYPTRRIGFDGALASVRDLDRRLRRLGEARRVDLVEQPAEWFGLDGIHVRWRALPQVWARILAPWRPDATPPPAPRSLRRYLAVRRLTPETWWFAGIPLGRRQPAGRLADGSVVWLF